MSANPPGPPPAGASPTGPSEPGEDRSERYGAVELTRHRKDDGRALILYTHDERAPPEPSA